ncbi:N-acetylglucosamine-6-phosphate deacetylase [Fusarium keratoplasticum]|uniref:N-acetylglucosamine-6-phosphate deacetylase n=1 Tax=Fusarium keratoplasticum TaxID=1328300 RepID=A0ACC0R3A0_9HYPO|nr:N-acetylglucosamine-6-phosphate deacetylase [Fusarium keratoplasticum]KAI8674738.1 N-acetylglucosamine-6-phosphate deacetylase [Fusarium keratoplasticum]
MPSVISSGGITKFTNCRLTRGDNLVSEDLWVSSHTGTILSSQATFFDSGTLPDRIIDLGGRIISPGLIDVQLNGAFGFNFSTLPDDISEYPKAVADVNKKLTTTGVTSYVPTLTSQKPILYQKVLPFLRPSRLRFAHDGAESLGAHVEGPFLNPGKNGIHDVNVLQEAFSFQDIETCYGVENLGRSGEPNAEPAPIKKITLAPERGNMVQLIPELTSRGIICSIGHSEATYEEASDAVAAGATMITHLFNAMRPLHHRNPGIFGVLGVVTDKLPRPYFGIIADGIHLHPTAINIAFNAHPEGFILVTDAMHLVGLPDAVYPWTNGDVDSRIVKVGPTLLLEGTDKIAGSSITLIECVNNFLKWSGTSVGKALKAVTSTPAAMLGVEDRKGSLDVCADADLVIFSEEQTTEGITQLVVDEVWKLGTQVYLRKGATGMAKKA